MSAKTIGCVKERRGRPLAVTQRNMSDVATSGKEGTRDLGVVHHAGRNVREDQYDAHASEGCCGPRERVTSEASRAACLVRAQMLVRGMTRRMITIEFDHRLEDHLRASRLYYQERSWSARADKVVAVVMALFGVVSTWLVGVRSWTVIWLVLAPIEWFNVLNLESLAVRYMFKRTPKFHERTILAFSEEQICYKTPSIDSKLDWSLFTGLLEDDELFVLPYKAPRSYAIVPKRAFPSEEARSEFRRLVRQKVLLAAA